MHISVVVCENKYYGQVCLCGIEESVFVIVDNSLPQVPPPGKIMRKHCVGHPDNPDLVHGSCCRAGNKAFFVWGLAISRIVVSLTYHLDKVMDCD